MTKINIETPRFTADQKLIDYVEKKMSKLHQFYDRIQDVTVYLKLENSGQVKDKVAEVRVEVPGDTLFASEVDKSFEAACDGVLDVVKRQLKKHKEVERAHR